MSPDKSKESKFKLEFTLKQHTPLIHFQYDQSGATLRATELKPKLDRFLIEYVFDNDFEKYKTYLIGYEQGKSEKDFEGKKAFDYKVKIEPDYSKEDTRARKNYFGNMGDNKEKYSKQHSKEFKITFFTFNTSFKTMIKNNFEAFLANTNFGTRQSKGYGCFYLADKSLDIDLIKHKVYYFDSKLDKNKWENDINLFYSFLRAGINYPNSENQNETRIYIKAAIFFYAKKLEITWDKKAIKRAYFDTKLSEQQRKYPQNDNPVNYEGNGENLLRDLFGLSSEQDWGKIYRNSSITKENSSIERFKSPIVFKPIVQDDNKTVKVYFWVDKSYEKMLNKTFSIKKNNKGDFSLTTPESFSFDEFFKYTFGKEISFFSDEKYHTQNEYKTLNKILSQLKGQI